MAKFKSAYRTRSGDWEQVAYVMAMVTLAIIIAVSTALVLQIK